MFCSTKANIVSLRQVVVYIHIYIPVSLFTTGGTIYQKVAAEHTNWY